MPQRNFPLINRLSTELLANEPYSLFDQVRVKEPFAWHEELSMWFLTDRNAILELLKDAQGFSMEPPLGSINPMQETFGPMMLSIDGPDHKRIRDAFIDPFKPKHVKQWYGETIQSISNQLIQDIKTKQSPIDFHTEFSNKLAIFTVIATIGLDDVDSKDFNLWYEDFAAAIGNLDQDPQLKINAQQSFNRFKAVVLSQLLKLKEEANGSILSELAQKETLTEAEIVSNIALTFFGGIETTTAMLSNTIWALLTHPSQLAEIREDYSLLDNAIDEAMRWQTPVQSAMRFATKDCFVKGEEVKKGEKIYSMLSAANRDPQIFEQPEVFDIHRPNANKHLSFAYGPHFCFGAHLAKLEAKEGLKILFQAFENLSFNSSYPTKPTGQEFRSPRHLILNF